MAAGNPGRAPSPARGGGGRGGGRGGNRGPGRGGNRGPFAGGLYNPSQPLQGRALYRAAQSVANAQVTGPMHELAAQIARNNAQSHAAQQQTFGYYMQLAKEAQDAVNQEKGISGDLSGQLQGVNQQTQQQLAQFGQQAQGGALGNMTALGLGAGQQQALQSEAARQQGIGALNAQTFQSAGANQGANYQGAAASNLGTFALRGQERLGDIGRAGQLANFPLTTKQAGLAASRGALTATALGQLRSQERNYQIAQQGLGIKKQAITASNLRTAATIQAGNQRTKDIIAGENQRSKASINAANARNAASIAARQRAAITKTGKAPSLTLSEQNRVYNAIDGIQSLIRQAKAQGHAGSAVHQALINGTFQKGVPRYPPIYVEAAYELIGWGHILPGTAAKLHAMGLRGGRYKVASAPPKAKPVLGGSLFGVPV